MRLLIGLLLGTLSALVIGCQSSEHPQYPLVITGSRCFAPLVEEIARRFESRYPDVHVSIEPSYADRCVNDTRQGLADIGMLDREPLPDELDLINVAVARDGVSFVVHPTNNLTGLNESQIAGILSRSYTNWRELGGSDCRVILVGQGEGRSFLTIMQQRFQLRPGSIKPTSVVATSEQVIQGVAGKPGALGYLSMGVLLQKGKNSTVRVISCGGVTPSWKNVKDGRYPLTRTFILLARKPTSDRVQQFLDFAKSVEVSDLIKKYGFVPTES